MALKPEINLNPSLWQWKGTVYLAGFSWYADEYTEGQMLIDLILNNSGNFSEFSIFCRSLNGRFSVVAEVADEIWIHTCHTWSYPVFYEITGKKFRVTDRPETLLQAAEKPKVTDKTLLYFLYFGVTPGSSTLHAPVAVSQPGESICVSLKNGGLSRQHQDWPMAATEPSDTKKLGAQIRTVFSRYGTFLKNRKVLLPLTRGYDSRLLACLLKEAGHENVLCATWGREGNPETETAAKVAEKLGFEYVFIPYTSEMISGFMHEPGFKKYIEQAGHLTSMPYLQDYFAVRDLVSKGLIDNNTVALPGHPGDFLRGSHLQETLNIETPEELSRSIMRKFGQSTSMSQREVNLISGTIQKTIFSPELNNAANFDFWDYQERQCKFIGNSSRVYDFFNIAWQVPLFDKSLFSLMLSLPFSQRLNAVLYNQTLEKEFFNKHDVYFDLKTPAEAGMKKQAWKDWFIQYVPMFVKRMYYRDNDAVFYREITEILRNSIPGQSCRTPLKPYRYNTIIIQWYLHWLSVDKIS
jgi:asparagine synthase (glutamine-hydrolysing)